jgi:hypothetical protein
MLTIFTSLSIISMDFLKGPPSVMGRDFLGARANYDNPLSMSRMNSFKPRAKSTGDLGDVLFERPE